MMKLSKELKAGLVVISILALFIWGFNYLKGKNFLKSGSDSFYTTYDHVNGLKKASPVMINGYTVGSVVDIFFDENAENSGKLTVEFTIEEEVSFAKNSVVKIYSNSIMGGKSLVLIPGDGVEKSIPGDFLQGSVAPGMMDKLDPLQHKVEHTISSADGLIQNLNVLLNDHTIKDIQSSIHNLNNLLVTLNSTTAKVDALVASNQKNLNTSISNLSVTSENFKVLSDSLAQLKILSISKKLDNTLANLETLTLGLKNGEGTLGKLTKDDKLYNNLEGASKELEALLNDVKEHPKRFVHFSLFGKKETPYQESK